MDPAALPCGLLSVWILYGHWAGPTCQKPEGTCVKRIEGKWPLRGKFGAQKP